MVKAVGTDAAAIKVSKQMRERELYRPVCDWLARFLRQKYRSAAVRVEDTSRSSVAEFLRRHELTRYVPYWVTLEVPADVTGAAVLTGHPHRSLLRLAIVEVKLKVINLRDLSQAIGYAKVVQPHYAFLVSPKGWTENLQRLMRDYQRSDVLEYGPQRWLAVARWDHASGCVRTGEFLLPGIP